MKNPKKNDNQRYDLMVLYIMVMLAVAILLTIAIYGFEAKEAVKNAYHEARIAEIDRNRQEREVAREKEWAQARQEIHEYFYEQRMEEARTKAEDFQTSAVILQQEFDQILLPSAVEVQEIGTEVENEEPENIEEEMEDDIYTGQQILFEETEYVSEEVGTTETEYGEVEGTIPEAETEKDEPEEEAVEGDIPETETEHQDVVEDDWFETQPVIEQQPEVNHDEPIPEPSIETTYVDPKPSVPYQDNSNANESLQNFLWNNGMTMEDFIVRMTCMVYPEACGEGFTGKQGVAEVAMNWIYSGMKTEWWDISSGFANIPVQRYYELWYSQNEYEKNAIKECRNAVEEVINGAHPVEDLLGVKPYYFLLPEKSDPINVYVMLQATYQIWVGNQLYLGLEGIDWTQKTN